MKTQRFHTHALASLLLCAGVFLGSGPAFALTMYKATVTAWHTSLMVSQGTRMVPMMTVNQGASLQVSDVTRNGWRQVLIRGMTPKWGWVAENEVMVGSEIVVKNLPSPSRSRGGSSYEGGRADNYPSLLVISAKGGYMLPFGSSGGPVFGADLGFHLSSPRFGKLYLGAQASWASASAKPLGFSGNATYPSLQVGVVVRGLFDSGFYAGALAGVSLIGITVGSASASTLQYSMSGLIGYDFRISSHFSLGPEVSLSDIALGGYDSAQFLGALRLHL